MNLRVAIVAEHASARFGGEAALALHYFRILRNRGIPTWLVVHERTRNELMSLFPRDSHFIHFVQDTVWHRLFWRLGKLLPTGLASFTTAFAIRLVTQFEQQRITRKLVLDNDISIVHQPMPVSPKEPSLIYDTGAPVIIGPMNGGMDYPIAFRRMQGMAEEIALATGRQLANLMNRLIPGKRKATMILVANERTLKALPQVTCSNITFLVENGVDLNLWKDTTTPAKRTPTSVIRFVFIGRLIPLKAVDLLLLAFKQATADTPMCLSIVGDDVERENLEKLAAELGLLSHGADDDIGKVRFHGWLTQKECARELQQSDVLVLPSLRECGGAVVLEAMAMSKPVIATNWGGPADYLDASCGILVEPTSRDALINNLAHALKKLARSPQECIAMGKAGRNKVLKEYDWEVKVDRMLAIYEQAVNLRPKI